MKQPSQRRRHPSRGPFRISAGVEKYLHCSAETRFRAGILLHTRDRHGSWSTTEACLYASMIHAEDVRSVPQIRNPEAGADVWQKRHPVRDCACFSSGEQCQLELKEVPSVLHALNVRDAKTADRLPLTVGVAAGASTQQYTYGASMVDSRQKVGDCFEYCWISASKQYEFILPSGATVVSAPRIDVTCACKSFPMLG